MRMSYFVAGLTNDNPEMTAPVYKEYHHVQYDGILPASATASVSFPPSADTFRYVIIQQKFPTIQAICLTEVKVFLRGMWTSCGIAKRILSVRPSIRLSHVWIVTKRKKDLSRFLYHTKDNLALFTEKNNSWWGATPST